ncbi:Fic family protein [Candidatus Woesearchaeota archaeon]|nr:Fic family protein [Candidatus Woesearchaeota archaeon]
MNTKTIKRIDEIVSRINAHPEYSSRIHTEADVALHKEAAKHSFSLELLGETKRKQQNEQAEKEALRHIKEGWQYLQKYDLSVSTLAGLGHVIEPATNTASYFRNSLVQFGPFLAPEAEKIAYHIDNLIFRLQIEKIHPIIRAAEAHIELVRIHPYVDGNGRAARLVHNFYLHQKGYPAAIIPPSDRGLYISLMENTIKDRCDIRSTFDSPSNSEGLLQEYFSSKVLTSVERLEEELKKRRRFIIVVNRIVDREVINSVSGIIRSYVKARGKGAAVQSDKNTNSKMDTRLFVIGDIGVEELRGIMDRCKAKYKFTYDVHPRTD